MVNPNSYNFKFCIEIELHLQKQKKHFYLKVGGWEYWKTLAGPRAF
jgi:hypothetical protein